MSNFLLDTLMLKFTDKETREARRDICAGCNLKDGAFCSKNIEGLVENDVIYKEELRLKGDTNVGCGCIIEWKTTLINENCPLGKWKS